MLLLDVASELAGYRGLRPAGSGGSAEVFVAQRADAVEVALKIARDETTAGAIGREALHGMLALSPRLPRVIDVGRTRSGAAYVALAWIPGVPLPDVMAQRPDERAALAARAARDLGEALADLHAAGLAHGDVKPANVVVHDGRAHLLDLGLSGPVHAAHIEGATLRYLARNDAELGDARARDLVALGALLAEMADEEVARASAPIEAARRARLPEPIAGWCRALLAPAPGARPSAAWVAESAGAFLAGGGELEDDRADRSARRVRAAYLRLRLEEIRGAESVAPGTAAWLQPVVEIARKARGLDSGAIGNGSRLSPLPPERIARWLAGLVGPAAAAWPLGRIASVRESELAPALVALAQRIPPDAWTFEDVEAAAVGTDRGPPEERTWPAPEDAASAAAVALALARTPPDIRAVEAVERSMSAPETLVQAAAKALALRGEHGRARSLVLGGRFGAGVSADVLAAEILRRSGDGDLAEEHARRACTANDAPGSARAALARVSFDRGDLDAAEAALADDTTSAPACEMGALLAAARGHVEAALALVARGEALATSGEERARLSATAGYALHAANPERAAAAYAQAVDHAVRSGAVVDEATYRTSEAAAAVYVGAVGQAIATARRAALLWEVLGRPAMAARALLASAAARATAGATLEAERDAREAVERAREGGDRRAEAYALWAIADVSEQGNEAGRQSAVDARARLGSSPGLEDTLRAEARVLRHVDSAIDASRLEVLDRLAGEGAASAGARLDWWGARAERLSESGAVSISREAESVLAALVSLSDARAEVSARGKALSAGFELATRAGRGEIAQRLASGLADAARALVAGAPPELAASVARLGWVARAVASAAEGMRPEQARDLEALVRSLSDRERLSLLLARVVDALVLWTGVERGLLLLRAPDGRLVPRAARNLARADLTSEQSALSQTLAKRALEAREPVVAVDAAGELSSVHASVHALKLRSVLAVPLIARGEALGVVYLDDRIRRGAFGERELGWVRTIATLAAVIIADARDQVLLRRAARRARRASEELAVALSKREAALDVAERELATVKGMRETRFRYDGIVGESAAMRGLLRVVDRVAASEVPVLISGESGSGKELVARAIHDNGPRKAHPFVGENCGAIPEGLLESALFGHVRGAFTGAERPRAGLFEVAHRGTLFLDEIGEMSLTMQTKLLRVLEDGLVRPVGSERARKVDVRIIAATNRNLEEMVRERTFREDLFYRLAILPIRVPALRERAEDIPLLVRHLLTKHGNAKTKVSPLALDRLTTHAWPGNVRQLENEIRRALVLSDGTIEVAHLSNDVAGNTGALPETGLNVRRRIDALERKLVGEALELTMGNQTKAAKVLGLSRFGLQKMIKRLGIA